MDAALQIYQKLLSHTFFITDSLLSHKFIFYTGGVSENDMWSRDGFYKFKQPEGDLGQRMQQAFENVFSIGYEKVVIIGSDCYELTSVIINTAFDVLDQHDLVIGPAHDEGYYLLGMKKLHPLLFKIRPGVPVIFFRKRCGQLKHCN
jgi:rSAM/selenodomain-associated transferase 1